MVDITYQQAIMSLWAGKCTITEFTQQVDPVTKITQLSKTVICENEPCRLSYSSKMPAEQGEAVTGIAQQIKLFIRPDLAIKAGSRITVTQNGVTQEYEASGVPSVYSAHQEIELTLVKNKA